MDIKDNEIEIVNLATEMTGGDLLLCALAPGNRPVGFLCYGYEGSAFVIRYIYVAQIMRRRGIATRLLQSLVSDILLAEGATRAIELYFMDDEEHRDLKLFFEAQEGFALEDIGASFRYNMADPDFEPVWKKLCERSRGIPFSSLAPKDRERFYIKNGIFREERRFFDRRLSFCAIENNAVKAAVFVRVIPGKTLLISRVCGTVKGIRTAFKGFAHAAKERFAGYDIVLARGSGKIKPVLELLGTGGRRESAVVVGWNGPSEDDMEEK